MKKSHIPQTSVQFSDRNINITQASQFFDNQERCRFATVKEVAEKLCVSQRTVRDWVYKKIIPFHKINGALRFNLTELDKWLGRCEYGNH